MCVARLSWKKFKCVKFPTEAKEKERIKANFNFNLMNFALFTFA